MISWSGGTETAHYSLATIIVSGEMEAPLLGVNGEITDYEPVKSFREARSVFWKETVKLWKIGGPIALAVICNYGIISLTWIFVGHLGEVQLSAVSVSLSVINIFAFGFMVIFLFSLSLFALSIYIFYS